MNRHEMITATDGRQYDYVRDACGRFVALIDEDGEVVFSVYYPPWNA